MTDYWHERDLRCQRSLDRAQAAYDAMQPPDYYDLPSECSKCGEPLESDYTCRDCGSDFPDPIQEREDYLADEADRRMDEQ